MTERLTKREYDGSVGISALRYYNYDDFQKMAKKLAHYEDLEEQGRLVVLPEFVEDNGTDWIDTGVKLPKVVPLHVQKYDGETLVFDFIACKNPEGIEGYYDTVSNRFYTDLGKALKGE